MSTIPMTTELLTDVATRATRPVLTPKRRAILEYLAQNPDITLGQATRLVGRDIYANNQRHTGALLAGMVACGLIVRAKRGVFVLPKPEARA